MTDGKAVRIGEAFGFAWTVFRAQWTFWAAVVALISLLGLGLNIAQALIAAVFGGLPLLVAPASLLALLAYIYVQTRLSIGIVAALLKAVDGGRPALAELWGEVDPFWRFLLAYLAFSIMLVIGLWLLVLPGLYVAARFGLYGFAVVDRRAGVIESFQVSSWLSAGHRWPLLGFWLIVFVLNALASLPMGLGLFVTLPLCGLAAARL